MMPVIEVGAIPDDLVIIEPGGAELGFKTFAETALGLWIEVDAFGIHVKVSVCSLDRSGRVKLGFGGNGERRGCGRLVAASGRAG